MRIRLGLLAAILGISVIASMASGSSAKVTAKPVVPPPSSTPAAPAAPPAPPASSAPAPILPAMTNLAPGTQVSTGDQGGTITVDTVRVTTSPADPSIGQPPSNGQYVIVHVTAKADAGKQPDINSLDLYAKAANGSHYDDSAGNGYDAIDSSGELSAVTLNGGETASGYIGFDVPARHGTIVYAPSLDGQVIASWSY